MNDTKHPNCKQRECVGGVITTMHTGYPCPDCNVRVPRATYDALVARVAELEPAAECWNAIASCYRITCMGYAGLPPAATRENGYAHATFNLWTVKGRLPAGETGGAQDIQGRTILADFLKVAIANLPVKP